MLYLKCALRKVRLVQNLHKLPNGTINGTLNDTINDTINDTLKDQNGTLNDRINADDPIICNLCKEYGIAEPEYTVHPNDIMMMFKANDIVNDGILGSLPSKLPSNVEITYKAICGDTHASNKELAVRTNQSERTIRNHTAKLKDVGYIKRVGSDKPGHWEIIKKE